MHITAQEVPGPAIVGNTIDLGEGRSAAIYRRDGSSWVAEFQWGHGTLFDASTWFRSQGGALRYSHGRRGAALETMASITPELAKQIERLHRREDAGDTRVEQMATRVLSAVNRWCVDLSSKLRGRASSRPGVAMSLRASTTPRRR